VSETVVSICWTAAKSCSPCNWSSTI
jgi:hypothetical protein